MRLLSGYKKVNEEPKPTHFSTIQKEDGLWYPVKHYSNNQTKVITEIGRTAIGRNKVAAEKLAQAMACQKNLPYL